MRSNAAAARTPEHAEGCARVPGAAAAHTVCFSWPVPMGGHACVWVCVLFFMHAASGAYPAQAHYRFVDGLCHSALELLTWEAQTF
jgi:hypothetical protein